MKIWQRIAATAAIALPTIAAETALGLFLWKCLAMTGLFSPLHLRSFGASMPTSSAFVGYLTVLVPWIASLWAARIAHRLVRTIWFEQAGRVALNLRRKEQTLQFLVNIFRGLICLQVFVLFIVETVVVGSTLATKTASPAASSSWFHPLGSDTLALSAIVLALSGYALLQHYRAALEDVLLIHHGRS